VKMWSASTASSTTEKPFEKVELQATMVDTFMALSKVNLQIIFDVADAQMSTVPTMQQHEDYMPCVHLRGACSSLPMSLF